MLKTSYEV